MTPPIQNMSGANPNRTLIPWGIDVSLVIFGPCSLEFVIYNHCLAFWIEFFALQGTRVLEDREIRLARVITAEGVPPHNASENLTKYTGASATPEWKDVEPGRVLFPLIPCEKCSEPKRQVRDVVPCQGRYLQRPVYIKTQGGGRDGLHAAIPCNSTCGPHRAEGAGLLDRLRNRTWVSRSIYTRLIRPPYARI